MRNKNVQNVAVQALKNLARIDIVNKDIDVMNVVVHFKIILVKQSPYFMTMCLVNKPMSN